MAGKEEEPRTPRVGVYVCHCGTNIAATVAVEEVAEFAGGLPCVAVARDYQYMCSEPGQELIKRDILEEGLERVVVASCSPRMHEPTFRNACEEAGLNRYCFEMANIREQCAWVHSERTERAEATEKAKDLVAAAVARAALLEPLARKRVGVVPRALVVGGGVSGIFAALEIADKGFETFLVEREPSVGGRMAQLDKTFPTLDCSACILTPKMVELERHKNIHLLTYSEVVEVGGYFGNYKVRVRRKPRFVDERKCTGCGECAEVCRLRGRVPNEFEEGLAKRSAIYVPFPQAVPLVYTVDADHCLYLTKGKCGESPSCAEACPTDAIDFGQAGRRAGGSVGAGGGARERKGAREGKKEELEEVELELEVGTIVVATGFELLKPPKKFGYEYDEVLTGLEFERLSVASGPTGGKILVNGKEPKEVVFVSCVGSRSRKPGEAEYCSRVCCMYLAKQAHLVKEKIPSARVRVIYNDMRAFGKGFEEFYERVKAEGVEYVRKELEDEVEVVKTEEQKDKVRVRTRVEGEKTETEIEADLVVLANAVVPRRDAEELAKILKISRSTDGFFLEAHPKLRPVDTTTDGVFIAGCCQSPKDIPDSVAQAVGAAVRATIPLMRGEVEVEPLVAVVNEEVCVGCGTCEAVCPFDALSLEAGGRGSGGKMQVNEVVCKGCGSCGSACPSGAISMRHFKDEQIFAQLDAVV